MTLDEFKNAIGDKKNKYSEEELIKLKDFSEKWFNILFNKWRKERKSK